MQIDVSIDEKEKSYKVFIDELEIIKVNGRAVILTNKTVAPLHLDFLLEKIEAVKIDTIIIEDGEEYKNFETINYVLEQMFEQRQDRVQCCLRSALPIGSQIISLCLQML